MIIISALFMMTVQSMLFVLFHMFLCFCILMLVVHDHWISVCCILYSDEKSKIYFEIHMMSDSHTALHSIFIGVVGYL